MLSKVFYQCIYYFLFLILFVDKIIIIIMRFLILSQFSHTGVIYVIYVYVIYVICNINIDIQLYLYCISFIMLDNITLMVMCSRFILHIYPVKRLINNEYSTRQG